MSSMMTVYKRDLTADEESPVVSTPANTDRSAGICSRETMSPVFSKIGVHLQEQVLLKPVHRIRLGLET